MSAAHEIRHERFWDERLTPSQNKAVEMARNGMLRDEIAEEMDVSPNYVSVLLQLARARGARIGRLKLRPHREAVPIDVLLRARQRLLDAGVKWGVYSRLAEQFGITPSAVAQRFWKAERSGACVGVRLEKHPPWTPEEDAELRALWGVINSREIGARLGRLRNGVISRAHKLRLRKLQRGRR